MCTQMLQIRDVFLGQTMRCSRGRGHVDSPGDATNLVETCYLLVENNCTRKQHTLKAVIKFSRNIELYSCQTTHIKPKNFYQISKNSNIKFRFKKHKRHVLSQPENEAEVQPFSTLLNPQILAVAQPLFRNIRALFQTLKGTTSIPALLL